MSLFDLFADLLQGFFNSSQPSPLPAPAEPVVPIVTTTAPPIKIDPFSNLPADLRILFPKLTEQETIDYSSLLIASFNMAKINTKKRVCMFLAQCAVESNYLTEFEENLNYSAQALMKLWPTRFPDISIAQNYARTPEKIANYVYGGRNGNGSETTGDGWRYRGRGLIQITFKNTYQKAAEALQIDLINHPELAAEPKNAFKTAAWFWLEHNLNHYADLGDVEGCTRIINGGLTGLADRQNMYSKALTVLHGIPDTMA